MVPAYYAGGYRAGRSAESEVIKSGIRRPTVTLES